MDKKHFLIQYLKDKYKVIVVFCGLILCNFFFYFLYDVRLEPILYTTFLLVLFALPFSLWDMRRIYRKCRRLQDIGQMEEPFMPDLWAADTLLEQNYQRVIKAALQVWQNERAVWREKDTERDDYYTLWTHQIKIFPLQINFPYR